MTPLPRSPAQSDIATAQLCSVSNIHEIYHDMIVTDKPAHRLDCRGVVQPNDQQFGVRDDALYFGAKQRAHVWHVPFDEPAVCAQQVGKVTPGCKRAATGPCRSDAPRAARVDSLAGRRFLS